VSSKPRRILRPWLIVPLVVVLGAGAWFAFKPSKGTAQTATTTTDRTVTATEGTMAQTVSSSGTIEPESTEDLTFSSAGTVTAVNVKAGQKVAKGQVLATIGSAELQVAVSQAAANVDTATAKLQDDEDASASDAQITADYTSLASANAALQTAYTNLAGASLTSPIAGTVATVNLTVGQQLGSGGSSGTAITGSGTGSGRTSGNLGSSTPQVGASGTGSSTSTSGDIEVISTGSYTVTLGIDSTQIKNIAVGQSATVTPTTSSSSGNRGFGGGFGGGAFPAGLIPGGGGGGGGGAAPGGGGATTPTTTPTSTAAAATGKVTSVGAIATASSGIATFPVVVTITGDPPGFNAGASATVEITYKQLANVIQVPSFAVTQTGGAATVTVQDAKGRQTKRTVTTGLTANGEVQITSGLKAGETVVIALPGGFGRAGGATRTGAGSGTGTNRGPGG